MTSDSGLHSWLHGYVSFFRCFPLFIHTRREWPTVSSSISEVKESFEETLLRWVTGKRRKERKKDRWQNSFKEVTDLVRISQYFFTLEKDWHEKESFQKMEYFMQSFSRSILLLQKKPVELILDPQDGKLMSLSRSIFTAGNVGKKSRHSCLQPFSRSTGTPE